MTPLAMMRRLILKQEIVCDRTRLGLTDSGHRHGRAGIDSAGINQPAYEITAVVCRGAADIETAGKTGEGRAGLSAGTGHAGDGMAAGAAIADHQRGCGIAGSGIQGGSSAPEGQEGGIEECRDKERHHGGATRWAIRKEPGSVDDLIPRGPACQAEVVAPSQRVMPTKATPNRLADPHLPALSNPIPRLYPSRACHVAEQHPAGVAFV